MSVLERQLAVWARQRQDQRHQQSYAADDKTIESYAMPQLQSLIDNDSGYREMTNRSMNSDQYFDSILPEFGDCRLAGTEFSGDAISIASLELASGSSPDMDHSFSLNSTCTKSRVVAEEEKNGGSASTENTASMIGGRNLKKRKAELIVPDDCKDKERTGESRRGESEVAAKSIREASTETDYIHVRARRGQATDSHSLAERARREKINKKMKCLQDLVPGCSKVTGKAGMLEEIINYVQSLQRQVEFLSMKLATLNPRIDLDIDSFFMKQFPAYVTTAFPAAAAPSEMANLAYLQLSQAQQGANGCGSDMPINPTQLGSQTTPSSSLSIPIPKVYLDSSFFPQAQAQAQAQPLSTWETNLHTLRNGEFG